MRELRRYVTTLNGIGYPIGDVYVCTEQFTAVRRQLSYAARSRVASRLAARLHEREPLQRNRAAQFEFHVIRLYYHTVLVYRIHTFRVQARLQL